MRVMEASSANRDPLRRFASFSLCAMLLLILVAGATLGWAIREARKQGIGVAEMEKMQCIIYYDQSIRPPNAMERLRMLLGDAHPRNVIEVIACDSNFSDVDMIHLYELSTIETLCLDGTRITDAGLVHLQRLPMLNTLSLTGTKVTDVGLDKLKRIPTLTDLWLEGTQTSEVGIQDLHKALPRLASFH